MNHMNARVRAVRATFLVTLVLLVIQYVLGMIASLEVQLPAGDAWSWALQNSPIILLHIILGTLLLVGALVAVILSSVARHTAGIITASAGVVLLIVAWRSGADFLATQHNTASLWMALGFMGAFIAYLLGYALTSARRTSRPAVPLPPGAGEGQQSAELIGKGAK